MANEDGENQIEDDVKVEEEQPQEVHAAEDEHDKADSRLVWFERRITAALKVKPDRIKHLVKGDNFAKQVERFCDSGTSVFVFEKDGGDLEMTSEIQTPSKKKAVLFYKKDDRSVSADEMNSKIACSEVGTNTAEQLLAISKNVYLPMLTSRENQEGWSEVMSKEVSDNMNNFIANTYVVIGAMSGRTLLPLPPDHTFINLEKSAHDKESVHTLETTIISWTSQIKEVLMQDPEQPLLEGKHPGPDEELEFWAAKAANFNSVHVQLTGQKVAKVVKVLELTKSTYFPAFNRLCKEVKLAADEASDNTMHLKALEPYLHSLHVEDFQNLHTIFRPIMHTILLVWKHSRYYNTNTRMIVLVREICNEIIRRSQDYVANTKIFEIDPTESVDALKECLRVCISFKSVLFDYKTRANTECPAHPWLFKNSALFPRMDAFLERCHDVLDLMQTTVQFTKLEKVEIGGTKGKVLTTSVTQIYNDFTQALQPFKNIEYDVVGVENKTFDEDFYHFRAVVQDLERRIASVIMQAFDDSTTIMGCFKLLDAFENLLERNVITSDLSKKHTDLMEAYAEDLRMVQDLFVRGQASPPVASNSPPRAGAVVWVRGLMGRLDDPVMRFRSMGHSIVESEEGVEAFRAYEAIMRSMIEFEEKQVEEWSQELEHTSQDKLKQSLLRREGDEDGNDGVMLRVNFDPALVCLLREVKYFKLLNDCKSESQATIQIPESAMEIFSKAEVFRQQTGNLELIVNIYNNMLANLVEVERPLVQAKLDGIDKVLLKGLKHMNWKSHAIGDFIAQTMAIVKDANSILQTCKTNVKETQQILQEFASNLLMDRKAIKSYTVDEYQELFKGLLHTRYSAIEKGSLQMQAHLDNSLKVLKVNKSAVAWRTYVDYVNQTVIDGMVTAICASIHYLKNQVDPAYLNQHDVNPLLDIQLRLVVPNVVYEPRMGSTGHGDGMRDILNGWLNSFINAATLVRRLDTADFDGDYLCDVQEDLRVRNATAQVSRLFNWTEQQCELFRQCFLEYSYLWTTNIDVYFRDFLTSNEDNSGEAIDSDPPLHMFDAEIQKYKHLVDEIHDLPAAKTIGFFKVDAKPVKHAVSTCLSRWVHQFQDHLLQKVIRNVTDLSEFIQSTDLALDTEVTDQESMLQVMGFLRDVRKRTEGTDRLFEPLRHIVSLLSKHGVSTPSEIVAGLEQLPVLWTNVKKKALSTKEKHSKEQNVQAEKVKRQSKEFEFRVEEFFTTFKRDMPYEYSSNYEKAYETMDRIHHGARSEELMHGSLVDIKQDSVRLNEMQELFELFVVEYRQVDQCLKEARLLKTVWDMVAHITIQFTEWRKTKWDEIDVEFLQDKNKELGKEVKTVDKSVKNWPVYKGLEDAVKNMQVSLPLVQELHHPAMRERHWKQLMRTTGVSFQMGPNFSLGQLLDLKPHQFEDDVLEIVDRAQKELTIEKQLRKLADIWKGLELQFPVDPENPGLFLLSVDEALLEALEDNSMQLQNLMGSKYVQGNQSFLDQVQSWQRRLGMVDVTLNAWKEVQSKWSNLQSIFVGSADIRVQLPEESKRFEATDADWKDMMKDAPNMPNALEACNLEGRLEKIEIMLASLETCEKALADYLETKRAAYPRFYFVAAADLLDILSKGSNPQLILKHLPKCFDNIKTLEFTKDPSGEPTRNAVGMYSGEGEYVAWQDMFACDGAVEVWMDALTHHTHVQLQLLMQDALGEVEEKPREQFVFDWCAELASVVCRMLYTEDVNYAFEMLEEGNENSLKDYNVKQIAMLNKYAELILGDLSSNDRKKIIMLVTLDVHARDVVIGLVDSKAENNQTFAWMSQLKYHLDERSSLVRIEICDYVCFFGYEYIGNCGCLVVTPLTDRCYITLTQAMRLCLGGAPAGPAGTGKTETTKDLGRALGIMVYVFNCSDQMDYRSMGQIFKGLSQAGAWGCFDEFNRIDISVLSVVSTQWKCILDAIRGNKTKFIFEDEEITLCHSPFCSAYITMNPGYAGRTELPESVKALFRPCAMIVPDMDLICEIMLMSEGYSDGKVLARKFMILYRLSESLLSAQKHYDWKLRAVKTTLNVAGGMLRNDRESTEDRVLLRALRDFNLSKLVADDVNIFLGMIDDLFPKQREFVVRARELDFEEVIVNAAKSANLQAMELFVLKVSQLREILAVRWSVFVIGPAGCGKTELVRVLSKAENLFGEKSTINVLNPKSVTRNELYGYIHPATREWKDGLLSQIFRDLANCFTVKHEYLLLDGDIDAEWIESMNTVMDDNKTLTLASNERIPLTPPMRLLLEIENMSQASPATVSRGGVIFMNGNDVGWQPYVNSWIQNREIEGERTQLTALFAKYVPKVFEFMDKNSTTVVPIPEISRVQHLTFILEGLVGNGEEFFQKAKQIGLEKGALLLEMLFMYATLWSCGGALMSDKRDDQRGIFERWFRGEFADPCKMPEDGLPCDYYVDEDSLTFVNWSQRTSSFVHDAQLVYGNIYVPTLETERLSYLADLLMKKQRAIMLVGGAGTGKTTLMKDKLRSMDTDQYGYMNINLNCFTDSMLLQTAMESVLEKKTGRTFGPPGTKRQVYFIDDLNMPEVDKYGTQQPIALLRQLFDYNGWYSRDKLTWREINNVQVVSCLNPTAGSFYIDKRLQRSYCTYALAMPSTENLEYVFHSILAGHLEMGFNPDVAKLAPKLVKATVDLQRSVVDNFMPTAVRFHYVFNLRDMGNIFEGLLRSTPQFFSMPLQLIRLWLHECERVFCDRLISEGDQAKYFEVLDPVAKKWFEDQKQDLLFAQPIVFTTFTHQGEGEEERPYTAVSDVAKLSKLMQEKLNEYNECNPVMDLVLFDTAVEHVCRCTRIVDKPRGNALMVGVGGSGKQSLARLSAFVCGCEVYQITVTATYGVNDFKENLLYLYNRAGVKGIPTCFIMTDGQIVNERFLVFINDFLASGNIPDVLTSDAKDEFRNAVRNESKQAGIQDTPDNLMDFFIEKVRKNLHLILCFSPVGDRFRVRARQFPALINCTTLDYFHPWPQEALVAVARRFVTGTDGIPAEVYETLGQHMAFMHTSVNEASEDFLTSQRRYNYTTPKSFLDLIDLYKTMLGQKKANLKQLKDRLENGLEKMQSAAEQVAELQENLIKDMAIVEQKKEATDKLLQHVGQETAIADEQKALAQIEEEKCSEIAEGVIKFQKECEQDMAAAEPVIEAAIEALNSLDKKSLTELKALSSPPAGVDDVTAGVMVILGGGKIPKDLSWGAAKKQIANVDAFLRTLMEFDKDNTPVVACEWVEKNLFTQEKFNPDAMKSKSAAAAGMCAWVINIVKYFRIYEVVEPKRQLLAEANAKLDEANNKLVTVRAHVAALEAKLHELSQQFEEATAEKNEAIAQAEKTQMRATMADRLVNGLADEKIRWAAAVESFGLQEAQFVGDVLLASAFVSYVGAFHLSLRAMLVSEKWIPDMAERKIPMTAGLHPLKMLCDDAIVAGWASEGLPADSMSIQNGAIVCSCKRWPLMIDPQLQGIKWIRQKHLITVEATRPEDAPDDWVSPPATVKEMMCTQMSGKYLNRVEMAIQNGEAIMIENLGEAIDAVMEPVLMRAVTKRGRSMVMKLGDKEVEYDPKFQLYLQTKLSNPHYKPEIAAQTTLINFMITVDGLEEQLLALVVNKERPDLEEQKRSLMDQQNGFKVKLKELEDELLYRLAMSQGDILADVELIDGLESAKITSNDINAKAIIANQTEKEIVESRKAYIPVATRAALLYFIIDQLWVLDHMYRFSMTSFVTIFKKGMEHADMADPTSAEGAAAGDETPPPEEDMSGGAAPPPAAAPPGEAKEDKGALAARVALLSNVSAYACFRFVAQALFERHKLIFACQLCFRTLAQEGQIAADLFDFLLRGTVEAGSDNPLSEWMDDKSWGGVQAIKQFEIFEKLPEDLVASAKRFREWYELERPEDQPLPGEWKKLGEFHKLLIVRAMRPDRVAEALAIFVKSMIGAKYVSSQAFNLKSSFEDAAAITPIFFILSPGVDPVRDTERLAKDYHIGFDLGNFSLVSLGQGQEPVAEKAVDIGAKNGGWVFLQNIHLTPKWTGSWLEKRVEDLEGSNVDFRLFLSAEPAALPVNLLQVCVKLTNEPPEGLKPNLVKNFSTFSDDFFDASAKPGELRNICFALAFFHSVILQRSKFGPQGWNRVYPFNQGDLTSCSQVAMNYLESNPKVPWDDLKYIFGEIMYGGHITDAFDRRLATAYLDSYLHDELLEGFEICQGFPTPAQAPTTKECIEHIHSMMPQETPVAFGLHNNAEIGFRMKQAERMFYNIRELQPRSGGGIVGMSVTDKAKAMLDDIVEKMPESFDFAEIVERVEDRSPYVNVFLQEIERAIELMKEMKRSLDELDLGLRGDLQMSERMEALQSSLAEDSVPGSWESLAYPSKRPLAMWFVNFLERHRQLSDWTTEMGLPKITWLSGLFNPQSFLTAVMQTSARRNDWPLDRMVVQTDVTKKAPEEISASSKEGAYVTGLVLEGARWDEKGGMLEESRHKELFAKMPVTLIKAVTVDKEDVKDTYACPVYRTQIRGPTYIFSAGLKTKTPPAKWTMAGVAIILDVV